MQCLSLCYITLLALVKTTMPACITKPNSAVIVALLPLHSGPDCSTVELRGLQQAAALRIVGDSLYTEIKRESNILISIRFQDTCSSEEGAKRAALKSMVDTDQTCLHPPFFMGFIGPESKDTLNAAHQITKFFNATHIIPYEEDLPDDKPSSMLYVTTKPTQNQAQSIITLLHQLEWTTFSLAVGDSAINQNLTQIILDMVQKDESLCVINNVERITDVSSMNEALSKSTGHGIVVLADSIKMATKVMQANRIQSIPMVLFVNKIGMQNWQIPSVNYSLVVLQETIFQPIEGINESINASMYRAYINQQDQLRDIHCKENNDIGCTQNTNQSAIHNSIDASTLPISYAARLMGSALISAHRTKCRIAGSETPVPGLCSQISRMSSDDWQSVLLRSTALVRTSQGSKLPSKIRFYMDISSSIDVYVRNEDLSGLKKVGQITNGNKLKLTSGYSFPTQPTNTSKVKNTDCTDKQNLQAAPTLWNSNPKEPTVQLEPVEMHPEDEFYGMVTTLCGAAIGIFVFFVLVTYVVYISFRVKTEKQSNGGSPPIQRKPSRIARWRRGSGQSSRASIRTID